METLLQDLRYGVRTMLKRPGFTAVAVLSLALGIGANSAVFSLVNGVLFKPLPVKDPDRLVAVYLTEPRSSFPDSFSYPDYVDYRDKNETLDALVGHIGIPLSLSESGGQPELIWGELVTGNYFSGLGVEPALGRAFRPEEDKAPGAHSVAVLSHNFWQRRFAADPKVVGRTVKLNGHDFTVVGVAPDGFTGTKFLGFLPDMWVPVMMHAQVWPGTAGILEGRGSRWLNLRGRLKPGVTIEQAQASLNVIARQLDQAYPDTNRGEAVNVIPGRTKTEPFVAVQGFIPLVSSLMMGVVGLVLLIACANVANLLLARAAARQREVAVRLALGASRARLVRQLLTESITLALLGGALGILLSLWFTQMFAVFAPALDFPTIDFAHDLSLDWRVLGFTLALSLAAGVLFGLVPALQTSKPDLVPTLKGELAAGRGVRRFGLRHALVVSQVALSLVLLISAGLFIRSMQNAEATDVGFEPQGLLLASVDLGLQGYDRAKGKEFYRQAVERLRTVPGVQSASIAFPLPMDAYSSGNTVVIEGYNPRPDEDRISVGNSVVGPGYFQTMRTALVQGREFTERDDESAPRVVVVNETMARRYWPGQDPVGRRLWLGSTEGPPLEVIGVARDGKYTTLGETPQPYMFLPLGQHYDGRMTLLVRTGADPRGIAGSLRREVRALDETLPVFGIKDGQEFMGRLLSGPQTVAALVGIFGLAAVLLAAVGIYGVMNYAVAQRTREIGIRMALGAQQRDVLRLVVGQGLVLSLAGVAIGLGGAWGLTRLMSSLLYGVGTTDPATFAIIPLVILGIALLATYVPARRATRVDPMIALRYE